MEKKIKLSVGIVINNDEESPENAIKSCINNKKYIAETRLIYPQYLGGNHPELYSGWSEDKDKLNIKIDAKLDVNNFAENAQIIVEIPATCVMTMGDFDNLCKQAESCSESQTQFGLSTGVETSSLFVGYMIIAFVLEWFFNMFAMGGKLLLNRDIRARFVVSKGPFRYIPNDHSYLWYIRNTAVRRKESGNAVIKDADVFSLLKNHNLFKLGFWIFPYFTIWLFLSLSWLSIFFFSMNGWIFFGSGIGFYVTEVLISFLIARNILQNLQLLHCLLFPIYWTTFPLFLIVAKIK